jgi:diaminohydroxyphosphoribosylaminopyrimidine deaminase/5-amino-6-(5-phosphoribosylamino)uracil reductase
MAAALGQARQAVGTTAENPPVGCVIVRDGVVLGRGFTQPSGRPHAETVALAQARKLDRDAVRGATAYVTLEPCSHHGKTPPCADALIEAGISRVVIAADDPDPRVDGGGIVRLRAAGIAVSTGLLRDEAELIMAGFLSRIRRGRPYVTLKLATSLDGRIATRSGHSQWITGEAARDRAHLMRARSDAILVGVGTVLADNPSLTCRLPGLEDWSPRRIVLDSHLRLPVESGLVRTACDVPVYVFTTKSADAAADFKSADLKSADLKSVGGEGLAIETVAADPDGRPSIAAVLKRLSERGIGRLMVEGGASVATAFVKAGLVDEIAWFRAPIVIGGDGLSALASIGLDRLELATRWAPMGVETLGRDTLETFRLETGGMCA